jgi:hypothetical protein
VTTQIIGQSDPRTDALGVPDGAPTTAPGGTPVEGGAPAPVEIGGRKGPDPVRYGDWEKNGRCIDF